MYPEWYICYAIDTQNVELCLKEHKYMYIFHVHFTAQPTLAILDPFPLRNITNSLKALYELCFNALRTKERSNIHLFFVGYFKF